MRDPYDEMFAESHKGGKAVWEDDDVETEEDIPDFDDYSDNSLT